jgi:hypothetical protein
MGGEAARMLSAADALRGLEDSGVRPTGGIDALADIVLRRDATTPYSVIASS